jgi:hypothetical protein
MGVRIDLGRGEKRRYDIKRTCKKGLKWRSTPARDGGSQGRGFLNQFCVEIYQLLMTEAGG